MDKTRKKRIKSIISWCCIGVLVVVLAVMPLIAAQGTQDDAPEATIRTSQAQSGTITPQLRFGGTLEAQEAETVTLPAGIKLKSFLVKNGDTVQEGDPLAVVDTVTVMEAITQIQETLDYLDEEISQADTSSGTTRLTSQTAGRVKTLYAQAGDSVRQVMLEHGALAVLSLDGCMAVDIETTEPLQVGDALDVTLADGETVAGKVDSRLGNTFIITVTDAGYDVDMEVTVSAGGTTLGTGKLYIHDPWRLTAVSGTISKVSVAENDKVTKGKLLMTLTDTDTDSQRQILLGQRQEYEETMQTLFRLYQSGTLDAPCDGVVDGVDEDSTWLLAAEDGWTVMLLSGEDGDPDPDPDPDPEPDPEPEPEPQPTTYTGVVAMITGGEDGSLLFLTDNVPVTISDPGQVKADVTTLTTPYTYTGEMYLYVISGGTLQLTATPAAAGQLVLITEDGKLISLGTVSTGSGDVPTGTFPNTDLSGMISGGMTGSFGGFGGITTPSFQPYDLTEETVLTVTPQDSLTMAVSVDEMDIGTLSLGMEAEVTVTALADSGCTGTVTEIGTAVNSGGNSKFTVTLTMPRLENMLPGMSASAVMPTGDAVNCLVVPTAAICDDAGETIVYTALDEKTGELTSPVTVTIGLSDGEYTQILSGLSENQAVYYSYYEAAEKP